MPDYKFTNNATTTLSGALTSGATSLTVASAATFPAAGDFTIIIDSEIMLVTGVAGTTFTVTRAQEGTSAAAHASGATVTHILTAAALTAFRDVGELTVISFIPRVLPPYSSTQTIAVLPLDPTADVHIEAFDIVSHVTGTNDASNKWDFQFNTTGTAGSTVRTIGTASTNGNAAAFTGGRIIVNTDVDSGGGTERWLHVVATKTGTPGNLDWFMATATVRPIAA